MFLGLRTVIYPAPDLAAAKAWFTEVLGFGPSFDEPFYVGFSVGASVGGYELGLDPTADPADGAVALWGVEDADAALAQLVAAGATVIGDGVQDVGEGIRVASVRQPVGGVLGVIENPNFRLPPMAEPTS
jgi:predicted enzyme related to lactoylglutathione lyase